MATERDYLISIGLAKPGRGRFSQQAKDALSKARADGMTFDEPLPRPTPREPSQRRTEPRKPAAERGVGVVELRPRTLATGTKITHTNSHGRTQAVSDKNICGTCGVSLSHHTCSNPTALVKGVMSYVPVTIHY